MDTKKLTSARFWMALMSTVGVTSIVLLVILRLPEGAPVVVTAYFNGWIAIITYYFSRNDRDKTP